LLYIGGLFSEALTPAADFRVTVINYAGQVVLEKSLVSHDGLEIDLSALKDGIYLIRIFTGESVLTKQVVLIR
jgi:hypothetical protein